MTDPISSATNSAAPSATTPAIKVKVGGLSRAAQKLQAAQEKAARVQNGQKPVPGASGASFKAKSSFAGKKPAFQRKAV